jgi:hypothetical protein
MNDRQQADYVQLWHQERGGRGLSRFVQNRRGETFFLVTETGRSRYVLRQAIEEFV